MGVCHDLTKSEYLTTYKGLEFYFSSLFYQNKFEERVTPFCNMMIKKLMIPNRLIYGEAIDPLFKYYAIVLYQKIEKRGFRVIDSDGKEIRAWDSI